ncbi:cation:proton antiporter [Candidatus Sumerlaeota bacterium]|nr:cation:proton antiporter [Candidatus Sumerlaeota bacterium]
MVRLLISLAVTVGVVCGILWLRGGAESPPGAEATLILGLTLLAAHALGLLLKPLGLPLVTGYLLLGLAAGPHALRLISHEAVGELRLINDIALALIALTAGGELVLRQLRPLMRSILSITLIQIVIIACGMGLFFALIAGHVSFAQGLGARDLLAIALLIGVISVAKSPATTIAIITETRASGRFTETVLGVTILKDVLVILLFAVVFALADVLIRPGSEMALYDLGTIAFSLVASVAVGSLLAAGLAPLLPRAGRQLPVLVAGTAICAAAVARPLGLDPLILCIAAGFGVRNFTSRGRELVLGIESVAPMIYAVFFTLTGAGLDITALGAMWQIALLIVLMRAALTFSSTWLGSRLVEDIPAVRNLGWMGFIAQAGVTLGLSALVAAHFPGWGRPLQTLIVAAVVINQIVGPVLFKLALILSGEAATPSLRDRFPGRLVITPGRSVTESTT